MITANMTTVALFLLFAAGLALLRQCILDPLFRRIDRALERDTPAPRGSGDRERNE